MPHRAGTGNGDAGCESERAGRRMSIPEPLLVTVQAVPGYGPAPLLVGFLLNAVDPSGAADRFIQLEFRRWPHFDLAADHGLQHLCATRKLRGDGDHHHRRWTLGDRLRRRHRQTRRRRERRNNANRTNNLAKSRHCARWTQMIEKPTTVSGPRANCRFGRVSLARRPSVSRSRSRESRFSPDSAPSATSSSRGCRSSTRST